LGEGTYLRRDSSPSDIGHDIYLAKFIQGGLGHLVSLIKAGYIHLQGYRLAALSFDLASHPVSVINIYVSDHHSGAFTGQDVSGNASNAAGTPGDNSHPVSESGASRLQPDFSFFFWLT
jgi:hypothetical protein